MTKERSRNNFLVLCSDLCQLELFWLRKTAGLPGSFEDFSIEKRFKMVWRWDAKPEVISWPFLKPHICENVTTAFSVFNILYLHNNFLWLIYAVCSLHHNHPLFNYPKYGSWVVTRAPKVLKIRNFLCFFDGSSTHPYGGGEKVQKNSKIQCIGRSQ